MDSEENPAEFFFFFQCRPLFKSRGVGTKVKIFHKFVHTGIVITSHDNDPLPQTSMSVTFLAVARTMPCISTPLLSPRQKGEKMHKQGSELEPLFGK